MNIAAYVNRINYPGDLTPNLNVLKRLQKCHLLNVPFENLDIHYGHPIELDLDKIHTKVVTQKRGGFCYELNGLFHALLKLIGFESKIISARVYDPKKNKFGKEYDHLAIIVKLDNTEYLSDVGFGEFVFHPLELKINEIQTDTRGDFIIERHQANYLKVSKVENGIKSMAYLFTKKERTLDEFSGMCRYHQTNADSHFTQKKLISKPTESGRITLSGNTLKIKKGENTRIIQLSDKDYAGQLLRSFDVVVNPR